MRGHQDVLGNIPIFSSLSSEELGEISRCFEIKSVKKKTVVFSDGDVSGMFYILVSGKIKMTKMSGEGKEIIVELISPGDFFGAFAALKGFPYPANAVAMVDSVVMKIGRQDMLRILERFPNIMYTLATHLSERVREFPDTLKNIALERVESRIASLLLKLAQKTGEKTSDGFTKINMKLTKQDIAEMVGSTVETCIRIMGRFEKVGIISTSGGRVLIKNKKELSSIAKI